MAEQSSKRKRVLRESTETVRERASGGSVVRPKKTGKIRAFFAKIGAFSIWKPFRVVGRFLSKWLVLPYLKNSWKELRMVTWPDRKQTRQLTFAVILFSVVFGILVAIVDFGLDKLFKKVILHI